jgi:uncharacterized protein with ParB-like and HNH nuclease domain
MQANPRKLLDLFGITLRYVVPIFQRHYVWTREDQWETLWEDIEEKLSDRLLKKKISPHFMGALILDQARKESTKEVSRFIVIDGQQRLVTIQLLVTALRDAAQEKSLEKLSTAINRYIFNPDPELMQNSQEEIFKIWPTQFNREVFCKVIKAGSYDNVQQLFPTKRKKYARKPLPKDRLVESYEFFSQKINTLILSKEEKYSAEEIIMEIYGVLKDDLEVVEILLSENDDSQEIFHSLNSQGKPLTQSDLLRSFVFMRAEKSSEDRDKLYEKYWRDFEEDFWDRLVRRGNQWSSHLDVITRVFLSSKKGFPVDSKKVHLEYKNWIVQDKPYKNVNDELSEFHQYGRRYRYLIEGSDKKDEFSDFTERLRIWDISTIYPLIIYLFEESGLELSDLKACFNDLESFIVRRIICNKQTKEYNIFFLEIIKTLREEGASRGRLRECLLEGGGETREWPNDETFASNWHNRSIYNNLNSQQIVTILKIIEDKIRSSKSETITINQASVEHIMPQKWCDHYELDGQIIPSEMTTDWFFSFDEDKKAIWDKIKDKVSRRNQLIQTIGNLTIVTQPLNSALSNGPFNLKKIELLHSSLMLNHYLHNITDWDENTIVDRAKHLFQYALKIWPYPEVK